MDERPFETLNVIPLVDVMLVLLTMVLTTANIIATGRIPVALPQASPSQVEKHKDRTIELAATGGLYFDGEAVSKEELENRVKSMPPDTSFPIRAHRAIQFRSFIDVADILKRLNVTKVAIQTQSARK